MAHRRTLLAAATVLAVVGGTVAVQLVPGAAPVARAEGLVPYDGCDELLGHYRRELRATATPWGLGGGFGSGRLFAAEGDAAASVGGSAVRAAAPAAAGAGADQAVGAGGTGTNLQEQGVDEPDRVKLRDGRLVVLAKGRIQVLTAEAEPRVVGSLRLGGGQEDSWGSELLLVGDRALVVAPGWKPGPQPEDPATATARTSVFNPGTPTTRLVLVDLAQDQPRLLEEATYDAQYVSARLTGSTVRLVTTNRPQPPQTQPRQPGPAAEQEALAANQAAADTLGLRALLPQVVRQDAAGTVLQTGNAVDCARTTHAEEPRGVSTLLVATLQPEQGLAASDSTAVTTDGDLVYASDDRLYVATGRWGTTGPVRPVDDTAKGDAVAPAPTDEVTTELHAFDTGSATRTRYVGTGSVPGYVLGRWALSEHEGVLRVATTRQPPWDGERRGESSSMVVKLEERGGDLVETGRVEGLGKTEQIKAVRYFGDLAAVVTFRQTDPLYLLDLAGAPKVLGELKVPGFSTYLHPIGGGKLLGLGQEADASGRVTGIQASVFDISDPSAPTQVSRVQLGQAWSPALDDSRAFTYDPAKRLAVFAFSAYDDRTGQGSTGALGLSVSEAGTVSEVGRLRVHASTPPDRVLVDAERVYAVSHAGVATGDPATMRRTGAVDLAG